jgi:AraC-like DNA-binding protein
MHLEPEQDWTVGRLASVAAVSRTGFALRFADLVGLPPLTYLRRLRIDRASDLLLAEEDSVASIAARVGYASEAAFCRAFKREVDATPKQWRARGIQRLASAGCARG